jgi:hypothetical protein
MALDATQWPTPDMAKLLRSKNAIASIMDQAKFAKHNIAGGWGNHATHPKIVEAYQYMKRVEIIADGIRKLAQR